MSHLPELLVLPVMLKIDYWLQTNSGTALELLMNTESCPIIQIPHLPHSALVWGGRALLSAAMKVYLKILMFSGNLPMQKGRQNSVTGILAVILGSPFHFQ